MVNSADVGLAESVDTTCFSFVSLNEMNKVKLMNRMDTKYWFHIKDLQSILNEVVNDYYILAIDSKTILPYSTTYFDTDRKSMFISQQNGKLNRYKIRKRTYLTSGVCFLETKFKSNKGRTIKERIPSNNQSILTSTAEGKFVQSTSPYFGSQLSPVLENNFSRIMLVSKNFDERCTIDFNLAFKTENTNIAIENLTIIEIKTGQNTLDSQMSKALNQFRIKSSGFSKYCIGTAITDNTVKRNSIKPKIRRLEKVLQTKFQAV